MTLSPYNTLQEQQLGKPDAPWRILVCCILLNRTHGRIVRPMIDELFQRWPTPDALAWADSGALVELIRPLGFFNQRTRSLKSMSKTYQQMDLTQTVDGSWAKQLEGCGQYAVDSLNIFVYGKDDVVTTDTWLNRYIEWRKSQ